MKAGLTIEELATEVMRQKDAKADYIVNTSMLAMEHCGTELVLRVLDRPMRYGSILLRITSTFDSAYAVRLPTGCVVGKYRSAQRSIRR